MPRHFAEFICNMPRSALGGDRTWLGEVVPGFYKKHTIVVELDPTWERIGDNLIGPAYGNWPGDFGLYHLPIKKE